MATSRWLQSAGYTHQSQTQAPVSHTGIAGELSVQERYTKATFRSAGCADDAGYCPTVPETLALICWAIAVAAADVPSPGWHNRTPNKTLS
jgi:hypothetical protein